MVRLAGVYITISISLSVWVQEPSGVGSARVASARVASARVASARVASARVASARVYRSSRYSTSSIYDRTGIYEKINMEDVCAAGGQDRTGLVSVGELLARSLAVQPSATLVALGRGRRTGEATEFSRESRRETAALPRAP